MADHSQSGGAAFELEDYALVPAEAKFKVTSRQTSDAQSRMPVWLAKRSRQQTQCLLELIKLLFRKRTRLVFEARGNFNA